MRLAIVLVTLTASAAAAEPSQPRPRIEVLDRGTAVEVIAHDVKATRTEIMPIRSRLEIVIDGRPSVPVLSPNDPTIHSIEISGSSPQRVLSVKLDLDRPAVKELARFAQAIQVGNDLHLLVPRALPAAGTGVILPEPTLPAELAATLATPAAPATPVDASTNPIPAPAIAQAPRAPAPEIDMAVGLEGAAAVTAPAIKAPVLPAPATSPAAPVVGPAPRAVRRSPSQSLMLYGALGLIALGVGAWMVRKRKAHKQPGATIDVIAQRSLGAKAKVVWFAAGGREMVVAVTPQAVRMLGQWRSSETSGSARLPEATALGGAPERPPSPAVAGILKLRGRMTPAAVPIADEIASDDVDADALWAKEILAATRAQR